MKTPEEIEEEIWRATAIRSDASMLHVIAAAIQAERDRAYDEAVSLRASLQVCEAIRDSVAAERDEIKAELAEISAIVELYQRGNCEWASIKEKLWALPYPDEPPASIVYQVLGVLCATTLDLVSQEATRIAERDEARKVIDGLLRDLGFRSVETKAMLAARAYLDKLKGPSTPTEV